MPSFSSRNSAKSGPAASNSLTSNHAASLLLSVFTIIVSSTNGAELVLYNSLSDGLTSTGASNIIGRSLDGYCTNPDTPTSQYQGWEHDAILQICADPWMGGGLKISNPNVWDYGYVTFLARAEYSSSCMPQFSMTCGWWPRYSSNSIELSGNYVAGGSLVSDEWRQVIIPTSDLLEGSVCDEKKDTYSGFYSANFGKCNPPPKYWITDIRLTDDPPSFGTINPTDSPTVSPSTSPTPYSPTVLWNEFVDDPNGRCLDARNNSTQVQSTFGDYLQLITDPWKGATLQIESSCFFPDIDKSSDPTYNHFTDNELTLIFELKATGDFNHVKECEPVVSMAGGHWIGGVGWSGRSASVKITHTLVDYGSVSPTDFRQVSIPMDRFKAGTDWDLTRVHSISFHYCPHMGSAGQHPKYYVKNMQVTKRPPQLMTPFPTSAPTVRVTEDASLATHRMIHHHWYPLLGDGLNGDTSLWLDAMNDEWPSIPANAGDHEVTVHIPMGSVVTYSAASSIKLDKVIVDGALIVQPADADVVLTCSTLVVEMTGTLRVSTQRNGHTVSIEIDGALNTSTDPEQTMVGLINLGGTVTISGDHIAAKMAKLKTGIVAGDTMLIVDDTDGTVSASWSVGDELVLPDTKEGRNADYWNFEPAVASETERVVIGSITIDAGSSELQITLQHPVEYDHVAGCHAAHVTRSIEVKTSASSTDRGHVMHTGMGQFNISNTRFSGLGRTTIESLDNTILEDTGTGLPMGLAKLQTAHVGTNQIARYALHSHHSMVKVHWSGNAIVESPRNCMVMHNSFGDITDNVAVGCNGTAIFLESGTESGVVEENFLVGTGGGSRGHDDGRFASGGGQDMAHGGFGIWTRGLLAPIRNNHAEGIFARSPYALFVHPGFIKDNVVPMVEGTKPALAGKTLQDIYHNKPVSLQTYGPFSGNSAFGTWRSALDLSYFSRPGVGAGHIIEGFNFTALASSGQGIFMVHSFSFDFMDGNFEAIYLGNTIVGEFCNNGDPPVVVYNNNTVYDGFGEMRGGNC